MKSLAIVMLFTFSTLLTASAQNSEAGNTDNGSSPISANWFAMHAISQSDPWPTQENIQFSSWRSVSAGVQWSKINPSPGVYDWTYFDRWMSRLEQYRPTILYTVYSLPTWASSCPTCQCNNGNQPPGSCYPPNDLNADGSGSDQHLKTFVAALLQHVGKGKIQYFEVWNEPNVSIEWGGTMPQMVSMTRDIRATAKAFDPSILITSPAETGDGKDGVKMLWLSDFLAAGGGSYVDVIGLHGYVTVPEDVLTRVIAARADMHQYGQSSKPVWVTEGSWCCEHTPIPPAQQPGFGTRLTLLLLSAPVSRYYLYAFESYEEGNLWDQQTMKLTPNATTYQIYYSLLVGSTVTKPCAPQSSGSTIWACSFSRSGGYAAQALWSSSLPLGKTTPVTVAANFIQYRDVYGKVFQIKNNSVPVGFNPIWLEN